MPVSETSRDIAFCGHAILQSQVVVVPDARLDPRFADNPLVTGDLGIAFYAACQRKSPDGLNICVPCIIDTEPRDRDESELVALRNFAVLAESELDSGAANAVQALRIECGFVEHRWRLIDSLAETWNRKLKMQFTADALRMAKAIAERALMQLNDSAIVTEAGKVEVTASFGVHIVAPDSTLSLDALLKSADEALYVSKQQGRNQVVLASGCSVAWVTARCSSWLPQVVTHPSTSDLYVVLSLQSPPCPFVATRK